MLYGNRKVLRKFSANSFYDFCWALWLLFSYNSLVMKQENSHKCLNINSGGYIFKVNIFQSIVATVAGVPLFEFIVTSAQNCMILRTCILTN